MIVSKKELLDLFTANYDTGKQAEMLNKQITESLGGFADSNKISKKALRAAFTSFKAFKEGKVSTNDEDYFTLQAIIEEHFAEVSDGTEDSIAG
jgi:hypothetical protein